VKSLPADPVKTIVDNHAEPLLLDLRMGNCTLSCDIDLWIALTR
jgi:hypothetical protein